MSEQLGTFEKFGIELAKIFQPLQQALQEPDQFTQFMFELGWSLDTTPEPIQQLLPKLDEILSVIADLAEGESPSADEIPNLINNTTNLIQEIINLKNAPASAFPPELVAQNFLADFPVQLFSYLIATYLQRNQPIWFGVLAVLGLIEELKLPSDTPPERVFYYIAWKDIPKLFSEPALVLERAYGWGTSEFNSLLVYKNFGFLMNALGIPSYFKLLDAEFARPLEENATASNILRESLRTPLYRAETEDELSGEAGFGIYGTPEVGSKKPGLTFLPYVIGAVNNRVQLSEHMQLIIEGNADINAGLGVNIRPQEPVKFIVNLLHSSSTATTSLSNASFGIQLAYAQENLPSQVLIGQPNGSRLSIKSISLGSHLNILEGKDTEFCLEIELQGGEIVIQTGDGDGFLQSILGDGISAGFDLAIGWSNLAGIYFRGSGGVEINLPTHIELGPIEIQNLILGMIPREETIPINIGASIKANLGPLQAVTENLGIQAIFAFPDSNGNLGPLDLKLGFKPPSGVGLSVDAGVVKGGGYLYFDFDREEYAGALELVFSGFLTLKAIGLITTKMPDGSKGFSLLVIITAEFGTGLQLGYGFTLLGVGGLVGLNRTMKLQPLVDGVRTGTISNILFPRDVIANAPRIISDLRTIFPPEEGKFLIGPMAKLGWGTPTLVSLSLGIIIEIPGNIAILGVLRVALPTDDAALLVLQVSFIGAIEFDKKRVYFFATLFESRILFIILEGEMGLLVAYGDDANFVVSVGGFHPRFNPPPLPFPNPARICLSILNESYARIRVMGYFAVTSNSAQFGARAELFFGFDAISVEGLIAFDALFQFSPFYFIIEITAAVALKVFGAGVLSIRLQFSLEGPTPWRAKGSGSISFLFFEISANFDVTWGESRDTALPPIEVMPILKAELEKLENWRALLTPSNNFLVSLRKLEPTEGLILHPVGTLQITQKAIPLDLSIDKVGSQKPTDAKRLSVSLQGTGLSEKAKVKEQFAIAQFQNMDDASKLSRRAYDPLTGGLEISTQGQQLRSSQLVRRIIRYEKIIIDTNYQRSEEPFFLFFGVLFSHFLKGNSISKSALSNAYKTKLQPFAEKIKVRSENYAVALQSTNQMVTAEATFASEAMAMEFMQRQIARNSNLHDTLHVIPQYEVML